MPNALQSAPFTILMSLMRSLLIGLTLSAGLLTGCGGSYSVNKSSAASPPAIRSVVISPQDGNSPEVTGYISEALTSRGIDVGQPLTRRTVKTDEADAVLTYLDVWRWDMSTYMQSIAIRLYDARTGRLLVSGSWKDSFFHTFHRGETVADELIGEMLDKLGPPAAGKQADAPARTNARF